jgi:hypothetical protein
VLGEVTMGSGMAGNVPSTVRVVYDAEGHRGSPWRGASGSSRGTTRRGRGQRLMVVISSGLCLDRRPCGVGQSGEGAERRDGGEQ